MSTIVIRDPDFVADYVRPHPNGVWGVYRLSYLGTGVPLVKGSGVASNVSPEAVAAAVERLQEALPLGIIGDYEVLCTGQRLIVWDDNPGSGYAEGIRAPGWIALSSVVGSDLFDLLAHEIAHELETHFTQAQMTQFWSIVGQAPGDKYDFWHLTPQERFAEYLSAALWGTPIASSMLAGNDPDPTAETLARIREWALPVIGRGERARVTIGDQPHIVLTVDNNVAYVDGREVSLDVAPTIVNDRTMVPVRFVSEALGRRVEWDAANRRVLIY